MKRCKLKGINTHLLKYYFDDKNQNNKMELDEIKDNVNGFDVSVDVLVYNEIAKYNDTTKGSSCEKEYIFFTIQGRRYGTFITVHNIKEEKALVKRLKNLKCFDVCIIFGK